MSHLKMARVIGLLLGSAVLAACSSGLEAPLPELETTASSGTATARINAGRNDAEEVGGGMQLSGTALDFTPSTVVGLRFEGLSIPRGAKISTAYIDFKAITAGSGDLHVTIRGNDQDSASAISSSGRNLSSRSKTSASSLWRPNAWSRGQATRTSDLTSVVQEIVSRGGWNSGNALAFTFSSSGRGLRQAFSYDKSSSYAPTLVVKFGSSSGSTGGSGGSAPSAPSSSCLSSSGSLVTLRGSYSNQVGVYRRSNAKVDARGASVRASNFGFVAHQNYGTFCLSGGSYSSKLSSGASWSAFHDTSAIYIENTNRPIIEGVVMSNAGDGVTLKNNNPNFVVKDSYGKNLRDDAFENDRFNNGTIKNNLIDNAFTAFSCREEAGRVAPKNVTVTMEGNLVALKTQSNGSSHNDLFKWTLGNSRGCTLKLRNNVFLVTNKNAGYINPEKDPRVKNNALDEAACVGNKNVVVYVGSDSSYLAQLKAASPACFSVTTDVSVWNKARSRWFDRHPEFSRYR